MEHYCNDNWIYLKGTQLRTSPKTKSTVLLHVCYKLCTHRRTGKTAETTGGVISHTSCYTLETNIKLRETTIILANVYNRISNIMYKNKITTTISHG